MAEATQGEVRVAGQDVRTVDPVTLRRRIGYVPQEGGLLPHWSVERNAALVPWLLGDSAAIDRGRIALERVGLDPAEFGARRPSQLSGGQRQRVAVARAIAAGATTVLLDEPFGALDAITRRELHDLFGTLRRELAITALLVTHDLHEAFALADRIAVMRAGRIEQVGTPAQLRDTPASDYVGLLLGMARAG
jgi:osmoprotectant transport system ATP-binding protein